MSNTTIYKDLTNNIKEYEHKLVEYAGDPKQGKHFLVMLNKVAQNFHINNQQINPNSFRLAAYDCFSLGLDPDPAKGLAYFVPYKGQVQLVIGYQGMIHLAEKFGFRIVSTGVIYDCDQYQFEKGTNAYLKHIPSLEKPANAKKIAAYAVIRMETGEQLFELITAQEVSKARRTSKTSKIWDAHEDEMWIKTAIRKVFKYLPKNDTIAKAVYLDEIASTPVAQKRSLAEYEDGAVEVVEFEETTPVGTGDEIIQAMAKAKTALELDSISAKIPKGIAKQTRDAYVDAYKKNRERLTKK
jgi:recombination protein RecT